jgi:Polyketide cyclase / dehydrase and lipid transport
VNLDVTAETTIARTRDAVAAYVVDHRHDPIWIGGVSESELYGDPPIRVGSRVRRVASFLGKRIEYVNEVERLDPDTQLEMRSVKSPFPMRVTYTFDDAAGGDGTLVRIRVQGDTGAFYRLAGTLMRRQVHRSVSRDLGTLKSILEH